MNLRVIKLRFCICLSSDGDRGGPEKPLLRMEKNFPSSLCNLQNVSMDQGELCETHENK